MNVDSKSMSYNYIPVSLADCYQEYENLNSDITVVGSLRRNYEKWEQIKAPPFVLNIIKNGYTIPFHSIPKGVHLPNNYSSKTRPLFVRKSIDELLQKGAVVELDDKPTVINPLTVSCKGSKLRLVLDLRHINPHIFRQPCKIEGAETLSKFLPRSSHMFGFDLKAGYHHVDIVARHQPYLGFAFTDHRGVERFFMFTVMPFGLAPAGFVFTKLLRVLIKIWRANAIKIVTFFYDGIASVYSLQEGILHSSFVKADLLACGYIPNVSKCSWFPVTSISWLGFLYELIAGYIYAEQEKLNNLLTVIEQIRGKRSVHVRKLAIVTGMLSSLHLAYGDVVYLKSKYMQCIIGACKGSNRHVSLTKEAKGELLFWKNYLVRENGMRISYPVASGSVSYSDSSGVACAAIITPAPNMQSITVNRPFTEEESLNSSTYRELLAVYMGLHEAKELLRNKTIRWFTDSKCVVSIVCKGSMKKYLLTMALQIFYIVKNYNISLSLTWISRDLNEMANAASRIIDYDDWGVTVYWFQYISDRLGMPQVDRFADANNTKLPRFNSRFFSPNCEAVDAFTQDWGHGLSWLVPPIYLVGRTIDYLKVCKGDGILVVPIWKSAFYWPALQKLMAVPAFHVKGQLVLGNVYRHYRNESSLFGSDSWRSQTLAIRLKFT